MIRALPWLVLLLLASCKKTPPTAEKLFEAELTRRGVTFTRTSPNAYAFEVKGADITANLENVATEYERTHDEGAIVRFAAQAIAVADQFDLGSWETVRQRLYWQASPPDADFAEGIREAVTPTLIRMLVVVDEKASTLTYVTGAMLKDWKVTQAVAGKEADDNLAAFLRANPLDSLDALGIKLGVAHMEGVMEALKASVFLAPNFREFVEPTMGWPVYVVAPARDLIYVIADKDEAVIPKLGALVDREFKKSGYPVTKDVMRVTDAGVVPLGRFEPGPSK